MQNGYMEGVRAERERIYRAVESMESCNYGGSDDVLRSEVLLAISKESCARCGHRRALFRDGRCTEWGFSDDGTSRRMCDCSECAWPESKALDVIPPENLIMLSETLVGADYYLDEKRWINTYKMHLSEQTAKIEAFRDLKENWDSYGSNPIHPDAIEVAKVIAPQLTDWHVVPLSGGGIQFEKDNAEIEILVQEK